MTLAATNIAPNGHPSLPPTVDVLIVEPDEGMREVLAQILLCEGYVVRTARSAAEALACMRETLVQLVFLDVIGPTSGSEFRAAQLRDEHLSDVPVVIMSGAGNPHVAAANLRVRDYLVKPLNFDKLLAIVRQYIG